MCVCITSIQIKRGSWYISTKLAITSILAYLFFNLVSVFELLRIWNLYFIVSLTNWNLKTEKTTLIMGIIFLQQEYIINWRLLLRTILLTMTEMSIQFMFRSSEYTAQGRWWSEVSAEGTSVSLCMQARYKQLLGDHPHQKIM